MRRELWFWLRALGAALVWRGRERAAREVAADPEDVRQSTRFGAFTSGLVTAPHGAPIERLWAHVGGPTHALIAERVLLELPPRRAAWLDQLQQPLPSRDWF